MFKRLAFCDIIQGMKYTIAIFSSLLCLYGGELAASDCFGDDCYVEPVYAVPDTGIALQGVVPTTTQKQYFYAGTEPMQQVKLLSIKPVVPDNRPAVWDGTFGQYQQRGYDKTVSWRDGVPLWDDSISSYKEKDFSDWYLVPMDELYVRDVNAQQAAEYERIALSGKENDLMAMYNQNMADAAATRARIEELLLNPKKPSDNLWLDGDCEKTAEKVSLPAPRPEYVAQDLTVVVNETFNADGCPFETSAECEIWRRKPIMRETVSPRSPKIRADKMAEFVDAARCDMKIDATHPAAAPLVERYKMLMASANACCTDGFVYSLQQAGASNGLIYKFMADDANFYGFGSRCLMMTDEELDTKYPNTATAAVAADVRNGCLCRGRQWFKAMLAPFTDVYKAVPAFKSAKFYYTYTDGLQREITTSINTDVQAVLDQLSRCP